MRNKCQHNNPNYKRPGNPFLKNPQEPKELNKMLSEDVLKSTVGSLNRGSKGRNCSFINCLWKIKIKNSKPRPTYFLCIWKMLDRMNTPEKEILWVLRSRIQGLNLCPGQMCFQNQSSSLSCVISATCSSL